MQKRLLTIIIIFFFLNNYFIVSSDALKSENFTIAELKQGLSETGDYFTEVGNR